MIPVANLTKAVPTRVRRASRSVRISIIIYYIPFITDQYRSIGNRSIGSSATYSAVWHEVLIILSLKPWNPKKSTGRRTTTKPPTPTKPTYPSVLSKMLRSTTQRPALLSRGPLRPTTTRSSLAAETSREPRLPKGPRASTSISPGHSGTRWPFWPTQEKKDSSWLTAWWSRSPTRVSSPTKDSWCSTVSPRSSNTTAKFLPCLWGRWTSSRPQGSD